MARILYVEDDLAAIETKRGILEGAGHELVACSVAEEAVELLRTTQFDVIITDWRLGKQRGKSVIEAAKNLTAAPVVVVSGFVAEAFRGGDPEPDLYLEKPVNPRELLASLEALLGEGQSSRGSEQG